MTGGGHGVNERAVDVQINRLRRKIERDPANPLFMQSVRGIGYRWCVALSAARAARLMSDALDTGLTLIRTASQRVLAANAWLGHRSTTSCRRVSMPARC